MKKISVSELKPQMKFSKPVYVDGESLLIPENVPLREKDLDRLSKWGIVHVFSDGEVVQEASKDLALGLLLHSSEEGDLYERYRTHIEHLSEIFHNLKNDLPLSKKEVQDLVRDMIDVVWTNPRKFIGFVLDKGHSRLSRAQGAVNTMILCVGVGREMGFDDQSLHDLAVAALFHDVGMLKVSEAILKKESALSPQEMKKIRMHPIYSYGLITQKLGFSERVGTIAMQHHERWNGTGYPRALAGEAILKEARILSVADAYEAMVKDRPYRNSMVGYTAMRQILNDNSRRFDANVINVFIKSMGIYPPGSLVVLNDGTVGRVVKSHPKAPLRPSVQVIIEKTGKPADQQLLLNLLEEPGLFITKAVDASAVAS